MRVFLTGGTGFLGEYLLAELLERNHDVWCLYRSDSRRLDTIRFLSGLGLPRSSDDLFWVRGDILEVADRWQHWCATHDGLGEVDTLLHSAASTRYHLDKHGEPIKTNLGGARILRELVRIRPMQVHLISTAYVCGLIRGQTVMEVNHPRPSFVTVYEESKWEAEQLWMGDATILRPSVIVGDSETGRSTFFYGWYILFHAVYLYAKHIGSRRWGEALDVKVDIPVDPDGTWNIVPVDYVARAVVSIIENPANHNRIFHLTHPDPPTHEFTREYIRRRFKLTGVNLIGADAPFPKPRNVLERAFLRQIQTILTHFASAPRFDRTNTDGLGLDVVPPPVTEEFLDRLIDYAIGHDWENKR